MKNKLSLSQAASHTFKVTQRSHTHTHSVPSNPTRTHAHTYSLSQTRTERSWHFADKARRWKHGLWGKNM